MQLENLEQIINGMTVFMPSGITATLSMNQEGNIIVEYQDELDSLADVYTKDDFGKIINDGIEILEDPSQMILEFNAEKVFALDYHIADVENKLMQINNQINNLEMGAVLNMEQAKLFKDRDELNKQLKVLKDRREIHMNENKIEAMNKLEKLAKCAKTPEDRRKANSLLNSLGMGVDVKDEVKKFLNKMDKEMKKDESIENIKVDKIHNEDGTGYYIASYHKDEIGAAARGNTEEEAIATLKDNLKRNYNINEISTQLKNKVARRRLADARLELEKEDEIWREKRDMNDPEFKKQVEITNAKLDKLNKHNKVKDIEESKKPHKGEKMNITKLTEELDKFLHEISDEVKGRALGKRIAQARKANRDFMNKYPDAPITISKEDPRAEEWSKDAVDSMNKTRKARRMYGMVVNGEKHRPLIQNHTIGEAFTKFVVNMMKDGNPQNGSDENIYQEEFDSMQDAIAEVIRLTKTQPQAYVELVNLHTDKILFSSDEVKAEQIDFEDAGTEAEEEKVEEIEEAFTDEMSMLTDINDLDFPQALADTVETTQDGEPLTLQAAVDEIKDAVEEVKDQLKDEIKDINDQLQAELSAEDLADIEEIDFEDAVEESNIDADVVKEVEEEIEKQDQENDEEDKQDEEDEEDKEDEESLEEGFIKFTKKGYLEDLQKTKQEIDNMRRQGKDAKEIKDTITMMSDNEKEEKAATEYAIDKIKESLMNSQFNCKLANLRR